MERNFFLRLCVGTALLATTSMVQAAEHEVKMLNAGTDGIMVFEPGYLKIAPGDTVHFVATDTGHNAVSEVTPDGSKWEVGFDGGTVKFEQEGLNIYYCLPHKSMAMVGVIQVGQAVNKDDAMKQADALEAGFAMNQGRLKQYMAQVR